VAVSVVEDRTLVVSAAPSNDTTDPAINPAPFTVSVNVPGATGDGLIDEMLGSGRTVIVALAVDVGATVLAAPTVTVGGFGTADGAKYCPLASIAPTTVSPLATPFTLHETVFGAPVTVAVNACRRPVRTEADEGLTATVTPL
jgi:hypothetical protein